MMPDTSAPEDYVSKTTETPHQLRINSALKDVRDGLGLWRVWTALAWHEFSKTYRRSILGIAWVMLGFGIFVFVKIVIFSSLLRSNDSNYYDTYLLLGFFIWMYLQRSVVQAPVTLTSQKGWINSEPLPLSLYIWKAIMQEVYNLLLTFVVVIVATLILRSPIHLSGIGYSLLAIVFLLLNGFSIKLLFGIVNARFRDLSHLVKSMMLPMLFLTPIFWTPDRMGDLMKYLWWNPFFHYLEIFRAPLLTGKFPTESWVFVLCLNAIVSIVGFLLFARFRQRIPFWI